MIKQYTTRRNNNILLSAHTAQHVNNTTGTTPQKATISVKTNFRIMIHTKSGNDYNTNN